MEPKEYRICWAVSSLLKYGELTIEEYMEEFGVARGTTRNDMQSVVKITYDLYGGHVRYSKKHKCYILDDRVEVITNMLR
ncbi:MAG: DeoR family transcriptional regulator [Leuconostoc mesenteroides]